MNAETTLLDRIRFLAENPEVGVQSFNAEEARVFVTDYTSRIEGLKRALRPFVECEVPQHVIAGLGDEWFYRWRDRAQEAMNA